MNDSEPDNYHVPVMLSECLEGLKIDPKGVYVDLTFGGGGHSKAILQQLGEQGKLFAFDQDEDAAKNADKTDHPGFTFIAGNFKHLKRYLKAYGVQAVDGILADLGISSYQIDESTRGFSTRYEAKLDMRMDQSSSLTAYQVINTYSAKDLQIIFSRYGEVKNAKTLSEAIAAERVNNEIVGSGQLKALLQKFARKGKENKYFAQVFQAIRIEVNQELKVLEEMLTQCADLLKPGGRLLVMSYHSLEDRLVKNYINKGNVEGKVEKDFYGNLLRPLEAVNRKPIMATLSEIERNNRARSAKLRIAEKP